MLVYRVEHPSNGLGPYKHVQYGPTGSEHPGPWSDPEISLFFNSDQYLFGFISLEQLLKWFYDFLESYKREGFLVKVYEVPPEHVHCSRYQAIFIKPIQPAVEIIPL